MIVGGFEATAHTFGVGIFDGKEILANVKDTYIPTKGGIHPGEAAEHHRHVAQRILNEALGRAGLTIEDIDFYAYSKGPGLPPCLKALTDFLKSLPEKPTLEVNHPVAHIEIAKFMTGSKDPAIIYVSGGNTQIIAYAAGKYRVFGESLDISIGNAIDTFMRDSIGNPGFGGPVMEKFAQGGNYIELPYTVKGMDLSFSGILTSALTKWKHEGKNKKDEEKNQLISDLCFSFQETCYSMLTEVTERAMAHIGKHELLLTGGVAASKRLREMLSTMATERGAKAFFCPLEYSGDNGSMIALAGCLASQAGQKPISNKEVDFNPKWRVDEVDILWM